MKDLYPLAPPPLWSLLPLSPVPYPSPLAPALN